MKKKFKCFFLLFMLIFTLNQLIATTIKENQDAKTNLRILELLPDLLIPLAIEPGIPANFIALTPNGTLDPFNWIYWGPKKVLKAYFENPESLNTPILRVKLSANVTQKDQSFDDLAMHFSEIGKKENSDFIRTTWGNYPIFAFKAKSEDQLVMMAWVGLNDPTGWTLMFNLVYPNKKGRPNTKDRLLWENLIMKTKQLADHDYFIACGQDLQTGYTLLNIGGAKLKMLAEKREKDGLMQIVVIPESPNVDFNYCDMTECLMGAEWKKGEPIVKVYGVIIDKEHSSNTNYITSIFYKVVSEFSHNKDVLNEDNHLIFQKMSVKIE